MPSRVLVFGGSGLVGTRLLRQLHREGHSATSADVAAPTLPAVDHRPIDILSSDLDRLFLEVRPSSVVHLIARVDPPAGRAGRAAMRALHLDGLQRVMRAAKAHGTERFILASSACVYGAYADNPIPLTEASPRRPRRDFPYAIDKAAQEDVVEAQAGDMSTAYIRPAVIYAKEARNYLTEILRYAPKILPAVDGHRPPLQFVHAEDVATALRLLIDDTSKTGAFNVGTAPLSYTSVAHRCGLNVVSLPRRTLAPLGNFGARFVPSRFRAPSYVLDQLAFPFVVDSSRLTSELKFSPAYSGEEALDDMLSGRASVFRS